MRSIVHKMFRPACFFWVIFFSSQVLAQQPDSTKKARSPYKNVVRYNLSSAMIFGIDKCFVIGYERVIRPNQTISVNFGKIALPKVLDFDTDSFHLASESDSKGVNASIDYRFYLPKENKFPAPHGVYIGPYYSFNRFTKDNRFDYMGSGTTTDVTTHSNFTINTVGFEMGYQFIFWKRLTLDLCMVGPGLGFYNYKATIDENLDPATKEQIIDALEQLLTQKFPGLNYAFAEKELSGNGTLKTSTVGYRFLIQVGFNF
jgi:hypothetical protein